VTTAPTRFASALSRHHEPAAATAEVVGHVLDRIGNAPDAALLFVSGAHASAAVDVAGTVAHLLTPSCLIGCTAPSVLAGRLEIEHQPAVALWAGRMDGVRTVRMGPSRPGIGSMLGDLDPDELAEAHSLVLVADPASYAVTTFLDEMAAAHPRVTVLGGLAAGAVPVQSGPSDLFCDGRVVAGGAVGLLLSGTTRMTTAVSQGCRPIGQPWVVTAAAGNLIHELAGRPAADRVRQALASLDDGERELARRGLHLGRVVDEHRDVFSAGDFLIRAVLGLDRDSGALVVGDVVPVGATVQLQVRDGASAHDDLVQILSARLDAGTEAALLFTCTGRGTHMFDQPHHDADTIGDLLGDLPLAGMFCAGEIGPVGHRSFVHGFTATVGLFGYDRSGGHPSAA
jgi:small ligand-binding sensory domain FIST